MRTIDSRKSGSPEGALQIVQGGVSAGVLEALERYQEKPIAGSTRRAYDSDWSHFAEWCEYRGLRALPVEPNTIARYLVEMASELSMATLQRRVLVVRRFHEETGGVPPTASPLVKNTIAHLRREVGVAQAGKAPLLLEDLRLALDAMPAGNTRVEQLRAARDRALLLVGWATALRRSELGSLALADVAFRREGMLVTVRRSKTDQEAKGRQIGVPLGREEAHCPVRALQAWLSVSGIEGGPLFVSVRRHGDLGKVGLSGEAIATVVQESVARIGLDPALYGGHSLRASLATSAAMQGADLLTIMRQTGHRSQTVAASYVRAADLFRTNAATIAGL